MNEIKNYLPRNIPFSQNFILPTALAAVVILVTAIAVRCLRSWGSSQKPKPHTIDVKPPPQKPPTPTQIETAPSVVEDPEIEEDDIVPPPKKPLSLQKRESLKIQLPKGIKGGEEQQAKADQFNEKLKSLKMEAQNGLIDPENITLELLFEIEQKLKLGPAQITLNVVNGWVNKKNASSYENHIKVSMKKRRENIDEDDNSSKKTNRHIDRTVVTVSKNAGKNRRPAASLFTANTVSPTQLAPPPPPPPLQNSRKKSKEYFNPDAVKGVTLKKTNARPSSKPKEEELSQQARDMLNRVQAKGLEVDPVASDDEGWDD